MLCTKLTINNQIEILACQDSGASKSIIQEEVFKTIKLHKSVEKAKAKIQGIGATDKCLPPTVVGKCILTLSFDNFKKSLEHEFIIVKNLNPAILIGNDFWRKFGVTCDCNSNWLSVSKPIKQRTKLIVTPNYHQITGKDKIYIAGDKLTEKDIDIVLIPIQFLKTEKEEMVLKDNNTQTISNNTDKGVETSLFEIKCEMDIMDQPIQESSSENIDLKKLSKKITDFNKDYYRLDSPSLEWDDMEIQKTENNDANRHSGIEIPGVKLHNRYNCLQNLEADEIDMKPISNRQSTLKLKGHCKEIEGTISFNDQDIGVNKPESLIGNKAMNVSIMNDTSHPNCHERETQQMCLGDKTWRTGQYNTNDVEVIAVKQNGCPVQDARAIQNLIQQNNMKIDLKILKVMENQLKDERSKKKKFFKKKNKKSIQNMETANIVIMKKDRKPIVNKPKTDLTQTITDDGRSLMELDCNMIDDKYLLIHKFSDTTHNIEVYDTKTRIEKVLTSLEDKICENLEDSDDPEEPSELFVTETEEDIPQVKSPIINMEDYKQTINDTVFKENADQTDLTEYDIFTLDIKYDEMSINKIRNIGSEIPILLDKDITLPPRTNSIINIKMNKRSIENKINKQMLVIPNILICQGLKRNTIRAMEGVLIIKDDYTVSISINNYSEKEVLIKKETLVGKLVDMIEKNIEIIEKEEDHEASEISEEQMTEIIQQIITMSTESEEEEKENLQSAKIENDELLAKYEWLSKITLGPLDQMQRNKILKLCVKYEKIWSHHKMDIGMTPILNHKIELIDSKPINVRNYNTTERKRIIRDEKIQAQLEAGLIEVSKSSWNSPCLLVGKSDGDHRLVVDYRAVNKKIQQHVFPLPTLPDFLDKLSGSSILSSFDLTSGFYQIELEEQCREITAFSGSYEHYQYKRLPQGMINSPATFQRLMNIVLGTMNGKSALCYIDDIFLFSKSFNDHLITLEELFSRVAKANLKLSPAKSHIGHKVLNFLGHIISAEGVIPNPKKSNVVLNWPTPKTAKELKSFLGLCSYYRKCVNRFADKAKCLYELANKETKITKKVWSPQHEVSFNQLKKDLCTPPVMAAPDLNKEFILFCDASNIGIGGTLTQIQDGTEKVIEFFSRGLNRTQRSWSITDKELLAVKSSIEHFSRYLKTGKFRAVTDHAALLYLQIAPQLRDKHWRMFEYINSFNCKLEYRPGKKHINCDVLSRNPLFDNIPREDKYFNLSTNLLARVEIADEQILEFKNSVIKALMIKFKGEVTAKLEKVQLEYRSFNPDSFYEQISLMLTNSKSYSSQIRTNIAKIISDNLKFFKDYIIPEETDADKHISAIKKQKAATRIELEALSSMLQIIIAIKGNINEINNEDVGMSVTRIRDEIFIPQIASKKKINIPNGLIVEFIIDKYGNYIFVNHDLHIREIKINELMDKTFRRQNKETDDNEVVPTEPLYIKTNNNYNSKRHTGNELEAKKFLEARMYKEDIESDIDENDIMYTHITDDIQADITAWMVTTRQNINKHNDLYIGPNKGLEFTNIQGDKNPIISIENLKLYQEDDDFCCRILENINCKTTDPTLSKKLLEAAFVDKDGILKVNFNKVTMSERSADIRSAKAAKIVLPRALHRIVFQVFHEKMLHLGTNKGIAQLQKQFYRPGMQTLFTKYVKECPTCFNKTGNRNKAKNTLEIRKMPCSPNEHVAFDILGPLTVTKRGNIYILNIIDIYSRFLVAVPLKDKTSKSVANALMVHWILKFGLPDKLTSDNAKEFLSKLMSSLNTCLDIKRETTPVYTPSWNSHSEKANHMIGNALRTTGNAKQDNWDNLLPYICFAYNACAQTSTGESPFYINYGKDPKSPVYPFKDIEYDKDMDMEEKTGTEYGTNLALRLGKCHQLCKKYMDKSQLKSIEYENINRKPHALKIGDIVTAIGRLSYGSGLCNKLYKKMHGPFRISKLTKKLAWIKPLSNSKSEDMEVYVDKLEKLCFEVRNQLYYWSLIKPAGIKN